MKKYGFLIAAGFAALFASCTKSTYEATTPTAPSGTFSGQFRVLHRKANTSTIDTTKKSSLQVVLNTSGYTFKVTGDTSVHAGSYGTYAYDGTFIQFNDTTFPTLTSATFPGKPHLTGIYQYIYSGSTFNVVRTYADTLSYQYELRK